MTNASLNCMATPQRGRNHKPTPWFRWGVLVVAGLLAASTAALAVHSVRLEKRLTTEQIRIDEITDLLVRTESNLERLKVLEARAGASQRVIAKVTPSIVFLQGAYRFIEPESGKTLRYLGLGPNGQPLRNRFGQPFVTLAEEGPVIEMFYTGTAFVASYDGLLITNRHVAVPWEYDDNAKAFIAQGLVPVMHRFVGYLAGIKEPFDVELVAASDQADVAVVQGHGLAGWVRPLPLSEASLKPGADVIVLGYPTGMRALLARADTTFVDQITGGEEANFWTVARQLSEAGRIDALPTRGIVGHVSATAVVYDAETTSGGSGGPVVDLSGKVVAVNAAILPEFGGSNLGVPVQHVRELLASVRSAGNSND